MLQIGKSDHSAATKKTQSIESVHKDLINCKNPNVFLEFFNKEKETETASNYQFDVSIETNDEGKSAILFEIYHQDLVEPLSFYLGENASEKAGVFLIKAAAFKDCFDVMFPASDEGEEKGLP